MACSSSCLWQAPLELVSHAQSKAVVVLSLVKSILDLFPQYLLIVLAYLPEVVRILADQTILKLIWAEEACLRPLIEL